MPDDHVTPMSYDCETRKPTQYGFDAVCSKPAGHDGPHESANFTWRDEMNWAAPK